MENSKLPKTYITKWEILKKTIFSSDRLNLLDKIAPIELNLFKREIFYSQNSVTIIYNDLNPNLKSEFPKLNSLNFSPINLKKPKIDLNSSESSVSEFYMEKVDNTGNLQLWPCEEILAIYCILNQERFQNKNIIELGAGFSGLCGLVIAKNIPSSYVTLTDGNKKCVEYLRKNINFNQLNENVQESHLMWDKNLKQSNVYDYVLISDCLFFKNYHEDLVSTIYNILIDSGSCIIVSPTRGDSLDLFLKLAEKKFKIYRSQEEIKFYEYSLDTNKSSFSPYYIEMRKLV